MSLLEAVTKVLADEFGDGDPEAIPVKTWSLGDGLEARGPAHISDIAPVAIRAVLAALEAAVLEILGVQDE